MTVFQVVASFLKMKAEMVLVLLVTSLDFMVLEKLYNFTLFYFSSNFQI